MTCMTIGVDADYSFSGDREPKNFQKLSGEQRSVVQMVQGQISDSDDFDRMRDATANLNDVFIADGLLGQTAIINSEFSIVVERDVSLGASGLKVDSMSESATSMQLQGVFVGCDVIALDGKTPELVYLLELPMATKEFKFRTAVAAVDSAVLMIDSEVEGMGESLELLSKVKSEVVARNLRAMGELREITDEVDADYLKEMSLLAIEILAQPEVAKSKTLRDAVTEIFSGLIDGAVRYAFEGFGVERVERKDGSVALAVNQIEAAGYVHAITTVEDFKYIPATEGSEASAEARETFQPAFVFMNGDEPVVVPIQYITLFYVDRLSEEDASCTSFRTKFLEEYPNVFNPRIMRIWKMMKYAVRNYFQKDEGGV